MKKIYVLLFGLVYFFIPQSAFAHEAYVLTDQEFQQGLRVITFNPFASLIDTSHFQLSAFITLCVMLSYFLVIVWSTSSIAKSLDKFIKKAKVVGPLIIRLTISFAFLYAAIGNCVFGPELSLSQIYGGDIIRFLLFVISLTILLGFFVEISALVGLAIFFYITQYYGTYMFTYLNYFGELIVLFFFGSRFLSIDKILFSETMWWKYMRKFKKYEIPIVRIFYGFALIYAAFSIKFQHQEISIWVYNQYHLKDFFHASANFIVAGAGLSEILIGLFIVLGFVMRFTILISLFFITISLLYFHELIWPHLMLYGVSLSLIINSADELTCDHYIIPWTREVLKKIFRTIGK